ncbi:MAG: family serine peptidase, partial [Vampirovibrio sp.]|nr:family serine peptidase [Vampirovibrio sp.]
SDYVISVAAADDKGTQNPNDDEIASFSSWGDGRYNPTISAYGVGVNTKFGPQDGTSFAAPEVAAAVARMKQVNPYLSFNQIKAILQQSATDLYPNSSIADGAGVINPDVAVQWAQQFSQSA